MCSRHGSLEDTLPNQYTGLAPRRNAPAATLSVVVITRNRAHFLREALASLVAQSAALHEIVVVDDGGDESLSALVESFGAVYVHQANAGQQVARNTGATHATGDWIAFLDDDDVWEPDRHQLIQQLVRTGQVDIVFSNFVQFGEDWLASKTAFELQAELSPGFWDGIERPVAGAEVSVVGRFPSMRLFPQCPFWPSTIVIHRDLYKRLGGWDARLRGIRTEDFDFAFRAVRQGHLGLIWKPTLRYRSHSGNHAPEGVHVSLGRVGVWQHVMQHVELSPDERLRIHRAIQASLKEAHWSAFATEDYEAVRVIARRLGWRALGLLAGVKTLWALWLSSAGRVR